MSDPSDQNDWPQDWSLDAERGPAAPLGRKRSDALIEAALAAHFDAPAEQAPPPSASVRARRRPLWQVAAALVLATLGVGGASAAVMYWGRAKAPEPVVDTAPKPARQAPPAPAPEESEVLQLEGLSIEAEPEPRAPRKRRASGRGQQTQAQDLLDKANTLRGQRRWRDASRAYDRAIAAAPNSQAAYVARVASAALSLEHLRRPARALTLYRAALRQHPRGVLAEEARFGVAEALKAMGRVQAERQALTEFLTAHPDSGLASRARARLAKLDGDVAH